MTIVVGTKNIRLYLRNCTKNSIQRTHIEKCLESHFSIGSFITKWYEIQLFNHFLLSLFTDFLFLSLRCLSLYPNSHEPESDPNLVLILRREEKSSLTFNMEFAMKIVGKTGKHVEQLVKMQSDQFKECGQEIVKISHENLFEMFDELISNGILTIECTVRYCELNNF